MKKLLSIALCAAAITSFAEDASVEIADLGVTVVTIPAKQQNTIIAASFNDVATPANGVSINNLIKTATGLAENDQLMIIRNGSYQSWKWNGTAWEKPTTVGEGASALDPTTTVTQGEGIWFIRSTAEGEEVKIVLYGAFVDSPSTTTTAKAWNLIGNAGLKAKTITDGAKGDKIVTVVDGALREYNYVSSKGWYYQTFANGARTVHDEDPTVAAGVGFWYYTQSAVTIKWVNE